MPKFLLLIFIATITSVSAENASIKLAQQFCDNSYTAQTNQNDKSHTTKVVDYTPKDLKTILKKYTRQNAIIDNRLHEDSHEGYWEDFIERKDFRMRVYSAQDYQFRLAQGFSNLHITFKAKLKAQNTSSDKSKRFFLTEIIENKNNVIGSIKYTDSDRLEFTNQLGNFKTKVKCPEAVEVKVEIIVINRQVDFYINDKLIGRAIKRSTQAPVSLRFRGARRIDANIENLNIYALYEKGSEVEISTEKLKKLSKDLLASDVSQEITLVQINSMTPPQKRRVFRHLNDSGLDALISLSKKIKL